MSLIDRLSVRKVETENDRQQAHEVLRQVYQSEKSWISDLDAFLPADVLGQEEMSWFLARLDGEPVGVTRVLYKLPVELYDAYGMEPVDPNLDVEAFVRDNRIAEIGRFAVIPKYRKKIVVAAILMRAAATETVERDFTHYITDVFETDPNSPMRFHQRILGFQTVATHSVGELGHLGRRITMLLDLKAALSRLRLSNNWIYRFITQGWSERLLQQMTV